VRARWDLSGIRQTRDAHMRRARFAFKMAVETTGETARVWRAHARQHVKAARREHWMVVARERSLSAGQFTRRTHGARSGLEVRAH
jgi:hypothetical protein